MKNIYRSDRMVDITRSFIFYARMNDAKTLLYSKTFQLAALQALIGVIVVFESAYPGVGWLMLVKSMADVVLRLYTSQPIGRVM